MSIKIRTDQNVAFARQPKPIPAGEIPRRVKARKARKKLDRADIDLALLLPTAGEPRVEAVYDEKGPRGLQVRLHVENFKLGQHVLPPPIPGREVKLLGNRSKRFDAALQVAPYIPDHLDLQPMPRALPRALRTPPALLAMTTDEAERGNQATTVFLPENRRVFNDTAYPWCTCGRVDTPGGQASGVMVGRRHMLTVSHTIQWNSNGTAGWVRFRPSFFDGSAPFGEAWGTRVYFKSKVTGPTIDFVEGMFDYVVVVLDRNIGDFTGWMGARGYTDSWDGGLYWQHIGYPGDLTSGNRPTFESPIALDGAWWQFDSHEAMSHRGDVWPGQSGGPFFGWWSGDVGPRAVAVQSSQNSSENNASGGQDLVDLIIRARNDFP